MTIGTVIREGRERKDWTQEDLAREVGRRRPDIKLVASQVSNYERGINTPRLKVLSAISEALDEPLESFTRPSSGEDDEEDESEMHRIARLLEGIGQIDLADELFSRARRAKARQRKTAGARSGS